MVHPLSIRGPVQLGGTRDLNLRLLLLFKNKMRSGRLIHTLASFPSDPARPGLLKPLLCPLSCWYILYHVGVQH